MEEKDRIAWEQALGGFGNQGEAFGSGHWRKK